MDSKTHKTIIGRETSQNSETGTSLGVETKRQGRVKSGFTEQTHERETRENGVKPQYSKQTRKPSRSNLFYSHSGISDKAGSTGSNSQGVKPDKHDIGDNSFEIWCICRVVKPCRECRVQRERDRDVTPTPTQQQDSSNFSYHSPADRDSNSSTPTPESPPDADGTVSDLPQDVTHSANNVTGQRGNVQCFQSDSDHSDDKWNSDIKDRCISEGVTSSTNLCVNTVRGVLKDKLGNVDSEVDKNVRDVQETAVNDLQELLAKLEELTNSEEDCNFSDTKGNINAYKSDIQHQGDVSGYKSDPLERVNSYKSDAKEDYSYKSDAKGDVRYSYKSDPNEEVNSYKSADFVPNMDTASVCSFDHFDFDTSFCSLKSSDMMMDQGDLADQLSLVQQMVMEMKTGFSTAMEELAKIQYGDQTLQQQLADNKKQCADEIDSVKQTLIDLKTEVQRLSGQIEEVTEVQRSLQEKVEAYQSDKVILLDELERNGAITDQIRVRLSGNLQENNNNNTDLPEVAPMVHPYLNSLQNLHQNRDDQYNSDSSLTAAVSRSLNLTQALGEKCLQLDISSSSSDEEENSRHSHSSTSRKQSKRQGNFQREEGRGGQKCPPHNQVLEEVQREEAARDIVEAEREYCSQIWSLLEDYLNPLRDEDIVSRRELGFMFPGYIPHMYEQHCIMLRKMEERVKKWKFTAVMGDVFARFTESQDDAGLNLYKDYINDFPTVINTMNKWFSHSPHFRELMQSQSLANSPVLSVLLAPLQQVPKYSLLLKNLLKYTPMEHPDRYYLESSLARLKAFLNTMNSDLEQAMQAINLNSQPITRSRDSARSRSSGSSAENNHLSRDSGVHSNEEERAKSPMSPNTTRRFVLQVLREKREQETRQSRGKIELRPPSPHGRFGSHPDLANQYNSLPDGRRSPHTSLPQSKMFSSLSKLPLPKEKGKRSKSSRLHEAPRPVINTNYLRPLTPQLFPASSSAYSFDAAKRREEFSDRPRHRPASAMEFTPNTADNRDQFLEMVANQAGLTFSPSHSTSSDHSRRELEMSLQKLLLETSNGNISYGEELVPEDEQEEEVRDTYQKQFLATKEKVLRRGSEGSKPASIRKVKRKLPFQPNTGHAPNSQDDYGIYGDDDDDDDEDHAEHCEQDKVKPMKLLPDAHRPKIMVPRWRQNASPQPPSYNHSVEQVNRTQNGFTSEENLAASLAQSLYDIEQNEAPVDDVKQFQKSQNKTTQAAKNSKGSQRKEGSKKPQSPRRSPGRQSPSRDDGNKYPHARSQSFDVSTTRPTDLNLPNTLPVSTANNKETSANKETLKSVSKLTDVIAYTADCLEKSESLRVTNSDSNDNEIANKCKAAKSLPPTPRSHSHNQTYEENDGSEIENGHTRLSDILSDDSLKVSSVDGGDTTPVPSTNEPFHNVPAFSFAVSPKSSDSKPNNSTAGVVQYFKSRDQSNNSTVSSPTFVEIDKTSTPVSEERPFNPNKTSGKEIGGTYTKREVGRPVREDYGKGAKNANNEIDLNGVDQPNDNSENKSGQATKERVLRKVDNLRLSFERQKQLSEERRQQSMLQSPTKEARSPVSPPPYIQKHFNEITKASRRSIDMTTSPTSDKPLVLKTFSMPNTNSHDKSGDQSDSYDNSFSDSSDHKPGMYRKAAQLRTPNRYPADSSSGAKLKLERATSPTGRTPSPTNFTNQYDKFKSQVESSNLRGQTGRLLTTNRSLKDSSLIPQRSKSPTRSSAERERPKSTTDLERMAAAERAANSNDHSQLKSALKDTNTKIPILKKSPGSPGISKSTEDISKIKKKSAFKTKLNNIFGRKKKKSKLFNTGYYDAEEEYNSYVTEIPEPSFLRADDVFNFPLTSERRSNSTSQILQSYHFESDSDTNEEEISAV